MNLSFDHRTIAAGNRQFSFREAGDGSPLVLLHGIGSNSGSWQNQLAVLSGQFRVLAWDAPGYGESTPLDMPQPDAQDYADALDAFLDAMQIPECCLVGHSLGTLMAAAFASLILVSCARSSSGESLPSGLEAEAVASQTIDARPGETVEVEIDDPDSVFKSLGITALDSAFEAEIRISTLSGSPAEFDSPPVVDVYRYIQINHPIWDHQL